MSKRLDQIETIRRQFVGAIVVETGLKESMAMRFANAIIDALQETHGGQRLYIPARHRAHPVGEIAAALKAGESPAKVCKRFGVSRRHLNRLFPGGLPKAAA